MERQQLMAALIPDVKFEHVSKSKSWRTERAGYYPGLVTPPTINCCSARSESNFLHCQALDFREYKFRLWTWKTTEAIYAQK